MSKIEEREFEPEQAIEAMRYFDDLKAKYGGAFMDQYGALRGIWKVWTLDHSYWTRNRHEECDNCGDTSLQHQVDGYLCHSCQNFIPYDKEKLVKVLAEIDEGHRRWWEISGDGN